MAVPARLVVYGPGGKPLVGSVPVSDPDTSDLTGSEIHSFNHEVYTIRKDSLYAALYGVDFIRHHKPLEIEKPVDKMSVALQQYILKGTFLPKAEIRWYTYIDGELEEQEYFRMTMEHVRLHTMRMVCPDVKDSAFERYTHLETISFCYQKITWLYVRGTILHTDIWNDGFFSEEDLSSFGAESDPVDELIAEDAAPVEGKLVITFTDGVFTAPQDEIDFDKKVPVTFKATMSRKASMTERKVYAKLYSVVDGNIEDMNQVKEGRLSEDGEWSTSFTLRTPKTLESDDGPGKTVEYYAEIESSYATNRYKSNRISPDAKTTTVYLVDDEGDPMVEEIVFLLENGEVIEEYTTDSEGKVVLNVDASKGQYSLQLGLQEITDVHFEDESGEKLAKVKKDTSVFLVVTTTNTVGKTIDIDLSSEGVTFEYNGQIVEDNTLQGLEVTDDVMKIELKTYAKVAAAA